VARSYYEVVISGRQLVLLLATIVALIAVAFVLGIGVGLQEPAPRTTEAVAEASTTYRQPVGPVETVTPPAQTPAAAVEPSVPPVVVVPTAPPPAPTATPSAAPSPRPTRVAPGGRWVQVAALSSQDLAEGVRQRVVALGFQTEQLQVQRGGGKHRVRLGPFLDVESVRRVVARLREQGFSDAFLVSE